MPTHDNVIAVIDNSKCCCNTCKLREDCCSDSPSFVHHLCICDNESVVYCDSYQKEPEKFVYDVREHGHIYDRFIVTSDKELTNNEIVAMFEKIIFEDGERPGDVHIAGIKIERRTRHDNEHTDWDITKKGGG